MPKYVVFLRGINVGGKNIIKMEVLRSFFSSLGFQNVKTYIQSGNIFFDSASTNIDLLTKKIESGLLKEFGSEIKVMIRTEDDMQKIIKLNPFKGIRTDETTKLYVCFLDRLPKTKPKLPLISKKEALEIFKIEKKDAFIISGRLKGGRYGFPTIFIEKELGVFSTARNWNTVCKMFSDSK